MTAADASPFDAVSVERLRRRRTVKWTLHGPDVLAAWVAEMDFDVAPAVRAAPLTNPHNPTGRVFAAEELQCRAW